MLELFGHLMTPEIAQKLGFEKLRKLKVFSKDEIEKLLESGPDHQSLLEDKDDKAKNSEG
jgi:hypothetical protein